MKKYSTLIAITIFTIISVGLMGCREKRISYVDMVKRETKEIQAYMDSKGITVRDDFPEGLVTPEKVFVKVPEVENLFVRVVKKGDKSRLVDGKTVVVTRFNVSSISSRKDFSWNLADANAGGTQPLPFIYVAEYNKSYPNLYLDPNAVLEAENRQFLCRALLEAVNIGGMDSEMEIITSFRYGPSFTSEDGIPMSFTHVTFKPKK